MQNRNISNPDSTLDRKSDIVREDTLVQLGLDSIRALRSAQHADVHGVGVGPKHDARIASELEYIPPPRSDHSAHHSKVGVEMVCET
jgi:hypothetical protein